ncbi:MAG: hypothetical protein ACK5L7_03595 [Paludibacteraceae bacterium]
MDLNTYGIQEMNAAEMRETDGGGIHFWAYLGGVMLATAVSELIFEGSKKCIADFKKGYAEGF